MGTLNNPTPDAVLRAAGRRIDTRPSQERNDQRIIEEFAQFLHWAGSPDMPREQAPLRYLAVWWYDGLITAEEGELIEEGRTLR